MTTQEPRLCIIGAGALSSRRIYPYIGAAGACLTGVCDLDAARAERNSRRFGGTPYTDWQTMLREQVPDGCIVCVNPEMHARLAMELMERGVPVYTEKPPAVTAAHAAEVARMSRRTGVLCTTAFKKRYATAYVRAREWLDRYPADDWLQLSIDYASAHYTNDPENPRSLFLLDFCIHVIDLARYLFGEVNEVMAMARGQDAYAVALRFANGAVGTLSLNDGRSFAIPTEDVQITVSGGNFMSVRNSSSWRIAEDGHCTEWREPPTFTSAGDSGNDTGHLAELVDFVAALSGERGSTRSDIFESARSMVLYEAIREAAESGTRIAVKNPEF